MSQYLTLAFNLVAGSKSVTNGETGGYPHQVLINLSSLNCVSLVNIRVNDSHNPHNYHLLK
jgi:hypothetical protein